MVFDHKAFALAEEGEPIRTLGHRSFLVAVSFVLVWLAILWLLFRRGVILRA